MAEQPIDRALPRPGLAIEDLLDLLGNVDVDRPVARLGDKRLKLRRCRGP